MVEIVLFREIVEMVIVLCRILDRMREWGERKHKEIVKMSKYYMVVASNVTALSLYLNSFEGYLRYYDGQSLNLLGYGYTKKGNEVTRFYTYEDAEKVMNQLLLDPNSHYIACFKED